MDTLLLIDGNALMHRAFHALPDFRSPDGTPTNILYGFFSMLQKAVKDFQPTDLVVCFDTPKPTFRKTLYANYQVHRPKLDDNFIVQIPHLKEALDKGKILRLEKEGFEADDVIGTIAKKFSNKGKKVLIMTGDKDILQLVDKYIFVISPQMGLSNMKLYSPQEVVEKLGVKPEQVADYKALAGDQSDNYPGAKGIGPKTAAQLLKTYENVENVYKHISKLSPKVQQILLKHKESVLLGKKLAQIDTHVKVELATDQTVFKGFNEEVKNYLLEMGIRSVVTRMSPSDSEGKEKKKKEDQMGLF